MFVCSGPGERVTSLPQQRQAEVEDFVDFLRSREQDRHTYIDVFFDAWKSHYTFYSESIQMIFDLKYKEAFKFVKKGDVIDVVCRLDRIEADEKYHFVLDPCVRVN